MIELDPDTRTQPAVYQCQVLPNPDSPSICRRAWDRQHTVLGYAVCAECWEAIREP